MSKEEMEGKPSTPAIEYPQRSGDNSIATQPRQPKNLPDLLRYSTEAANCFGEKSSGNVTSTLDEESKKFLEEAVKSMTVDVVEELLKSIKILQNANDLPKNGDPTECEDALDHIFDFVDNLDVANDFYKIGGFCVFKPCLESSHNSLRWRGAELVAELSQNNPYCQGKVLETGLMRNLLRMIDMDSDDTVRTKALYAVSCLVRENEEGFEEFIKCDGFSVLLRALQTNLQKLNIKSAFLLCSLCHFKPQIKNDLIKMGYVEQLIKQLSIHIEANDEGGFQVVEHLLSAILEILRDHTSAQEISRKPELQFKSLLLNLSKNSVGHDQSTEENDYVKTLLKIVFGEETIKNGE